jgi:RNA polymerase sigma-70 factor (ECF subfamily)
VTQNAVLRLCRALETVTPASLCDYYRLATLQIRRELLDLVRHHYGPHGQAGKHQSDAAFSGSNPPPALYEQADLTHDPDQLALWTEFHRAAQNLPPEEQEVFDLVYYQGMTPAQAAELLNVSPRTVKRRYHAAGLKLHEATGGKLPGV